MSKFDNSIGRGPYAGSEGLPQSRANAEPPAESREELNAAPVSIAAQTATPKGRMVRGRFRADSDTLANWRDEQDPVERRRLRSNFHRRQSYNRARQARINEQNEASTEKALEMQEAESGPQ